MGRRTQRAGFTLLEVLVAMVILGLVLSSLYLTFKTGMRAYDIGATHSEGAQAVRYTVAQLQDDLRNLYYKDANLYNVTRRQREALKVRLEQQQLQSGSKASLIDPSMEPELGPKIDLSFVAADKDQEDEVTFVRLQNFKHAENRKMWGLARIHYYVANNALYRSIDDIMMADTDEDGNEIPKANPPQVDKIANNVKSMDMKFGYYYDGEWETAPDWDSNACRYRNPAEEDEEGGGSHRAQYHRRQRGYEQQPAEA